MLRSVTALVASAAVVAGFVAVPLTRAGAQTLSPAAVSTTPQAATTPQTAIAAPTAGTAQPQSTTTGTFAESPAAFAFLTRGLGLPLGTSPRLTGAKSGSTVTLQVGGPTALALGLPRGANPPYGSTATLSINTAANTETVTSASSTGTLAVTIANASTTTLAAGNNVTGTVSDNVSLFNLPTALTGTVADINGKAAVSLSGALVASPTVAPGVVLDKGVTFALLPGGGLRVAGAATLGRSGHSVTAAVSGTMTDTANWTLNVSGSTTSTSLLPGLALAPTVTGTVTDAAGTIRYDVHGTATTAWPVVPGVKVTSGAVELSDRLSSATTFTAPAVMDGTDWVAVTGTVSTASPSGPQLATSGGVAFNMASGAGLLNSKLSAGVTLATGPATVVLTGASLTGHVQLTASAITGAVRGTATVSVQPAGGATVRAPATVAITAAGTVVVSFPLDLSLVGMGPAGTVGTVHWASAAVIGFADAGGPKINLPAGVSSTTAKGSNSPPTTAPPTTAPPTTAPSPTAPSTTAPPSTTFTVSSAVAALLKRLSVPLASATLSGILHGTTLTVSLPAPTALPLTLPAGIPAPALGPTTITVDTVAGTLTIDSAASVSTADPVGATLHVVITTASTTTLSTGPDLTATLGLTSVPFVAGSTLALTGSLAYTGGVLSASLTGSIESDLSLGHNVTLKAGALITLATDTGLTVSGTLEIGTGNATVELTAAGSLKNVKNWSLSLSDPNAPVWQPVPSLTLSPTFAGSVTDTGGTIRFDLATTNVTGTAPLTWDAGAGAALSVTHLEVSDSTPPSGVTCPTTVADGDIWVDLQGSFAYSPANLNLPAEGCIDLTAQTFTIGTTATGTLLPGNPLLNITSAALAVTGNIAKHTFNVTGTATLAVTGVAAQPSFPVGVSFGTDGVIVGAQLPDLSSLGLSGSGSVYVSSSKVDNFDPTPLGISATPFDLPAGLSVSLEYVLPANITTAFANIGIHLGPQTAVRTIATLSASGFSLDIGLNFGAGTNGVQVVDTNGTGVFLNTLVVGLTVGTQNTVSLSGSAFFELPALIPGTVASQVEVTISGMFNFDTLTLSLGLKLSNWINALGVNGLNLADFAGTLGIDLENGIPVPSLGLSADNIVLPAAWATAIGMNPGTQISFDANVNLDAPLLSFSILGPAGQPALTPLAVGTTNTNIINSLVVNQAALVLAPAGGITAAGDTVAPGVSVIFDAVIDNVPAHIDASVGLAPPSIDAHVAVGSFSVGPINIASPMLHLHLSPTSLQIGFSGGATSDNYSLSAGVALAVGDSANGASISLGVTGGLPYWLTATGTLTGSISGDGSGASIYASGYGYLTAGGSNLGPVTFTYSGRLSWSDAVDSFNQIATFFNNAGTGVGQIVQILQNLGANQQDIVNVLNAIGINPSTVLSSVTSVFGLINNNYNYIWVNPTALQLYVLDVSDGSQDPNAPIIDWTLNGGYNQQWAFIPGPQGYEIVNRGSGQCLSVGNSSTDPGGALVQYPCYGYTDQLWNIGSLNTYDHEQITSVSSGLVVDVAGASFWPGATIDQWTNNNDGSSNQYFWLSPGTN